MLLKVVFFVADVFCHSKDFHVIVNHKTIENLRTMIWIQYTSVYLLSIDNFPQSV